MKAGNSLLELLEAAPAKVQVYDMGRRIVRIPRDQFLLFEQTAIPYPQPLGQQAWCALARLEQQPVAEPTIWFLRFPLDELGKLVQASRDYFVHRLLEAAAEPRSAMAAAAHDAFRDNPYVFKPAAERMAVLHARLSRDLRRTPSRFFDHARAYFSGRLRWDEWKFVGYQGIADIALRVTEADTEEMLVEAIPHLPQEPLTALCHCLENVRLPPATSDALLRRLSTELARTDPQPTTLAALIRGLSDSQSAGIRQRMFDRVMNSPLYNHAEVLAAIAGRAWEQLSQPREMARYLQALAENAGGQRFFNECVADLLRLPGLREPLLAAMRNPACSELLAARFLSMTGELAAGNKGRD